MKRRCEDWISSYIECTSKSKSPTEFHVWSAICLIAAALQRKVWVEKNYYKIYPNMFIFLVGGPGVGKGTAINFALSEFLYKSQDVSLMSDWLSGPKLIKDFASSERTVMTQQGRVYTHCSITAAVRELGVFLRRDNLEFQKLLCELYDCQDKWEYGTKHFGTDPLRNIWFNFIAGVTNRWVMDNITIESLEEGFASRVIFVNSDNVKYGKVFDPLTDFQQKLRDDLFHDFSVMSKMYGRIRFDDDAREYIEDWWSNFNPTIKKQPYMFQGYYNRKETHLIKLSVISMASAGRETVSLNDVIGAKKMIDYIEPAMFSLFSATGRSPKAPAIDLILKTLETYDGVGVPHKELKALLIKDIDTSIFEEVVENMLSAGFVAYKKDKYSNNMHYHLTEKAKMR